mgnify:CR=1 FL=1|jgi:hypothetical protein
MKSVKDNPMKIIFLFLNFLYLFQCNNNVKDNNLKVSNHSDIPSPPSLPDSLVQKYKATKFFNFLVIENTDLRNELHSLYNLVEINYQETPLEPNLWLSIFTLGDTEYNFVVRDKSVIFKDASSIYHAKRNFKYKDWNHDGNKDIVAYNGQCESGCFGYHEYMEVYTVEKDTVLLTVQLPLKERICHPQGTSITTYTYKVNKNQVSVKKTEGTRRDCNADDIQKVEAVTHKSFLLDTLTDKTLTEL